MDWNYSVTYDAWLIFKSGEGYWLGRFFKKGFGHVLYLTKDEYNWMAHDPHKLRLCSFVPSYKVGEDLPRLLRNDGYTVLKITFFDRSTKTKMRHSRLNNCVSFVKYALGIKVFAFTPYGLFKKLLRLNERQRFKNGIRNVQIIH